MLETKTIRRLDTLFETQGFETQGLESTGNSRLILTPNRRLSRFVQQQYGDRQCRSGVKAWQTLPCFALEDWLQSLWEQLQVAGLEPGNKTLLNPFQESLIWEKVIEQHSGEEALLDLQQVATLARNGWQSLVLWLQDPLEIKGGHEDTNMFRVWAKAFHQYCKKKGFIDKASMQAALLTFFQSQAHSKTTGTVLLPEQLDLLGFDNLNPCTLELLESFVDSGVRVQSFNLHNDGQVKRIALEDEEAEIFNAARWAAAKLEIEPKARIGIVSPKLARQRQGFERLFNRVFEPQSILPGRPRHAPGFNMSVAQPLNETPPVSAALQILQLNKREIDIETASLVLGSVFVGIEAEHSARAVLDAQLRRQYRDLTPGILRAACGESAGPKAARASESPICPDLYHRLQALHSGQRGRPRLQLPSQWGQQFLQQLRILGWPGKRPLDTLEYQQVQVWQEVLASMVSLDLVAGEINLSQALNYLERLSYTPFHPQTTSSPLQILGLLEAAGMQFDYLWVLGLDNRSWPEAPEPNPFIPRSLQVALSMPNASAEKELLYAQALTQRLAGSAEEVVFSHSQFTGDQSLQASPLIEHVEALELEQVPLMNCADYPSDLFKQVTLEKLDDIRGPSLVEGALVRGGTQILKDQAACPFRAFAKHRLKAKELEQVGPGITPLDRGSLIHDTLEVVWRQLGSHSKLVALDREALVRFIQQSVEKAIHPLKSQKRLGSNTLLLEAQRTEGLVRQWLELEKRRQPFEVLFNETTDELHLGGLVLNIRYDRIDRLANDGLVVVDYKSGTPELKTWAGERPDEPQVPLYCLANEENVVAAAYGQINANEVVFKGIGQEEGIAPALKVPEQLSGMGLPECWPDILAYWRQQLSQLAEEFAQGIARVQPKKGADACRYCTLHSLCRVNTRKVS